MLFSTQLSFVRVARLFSCCSLGGPLSYSSKNTTAGKLYDSGPPKEQQYTGNAPITAVENQPIAAEHRALVHCIYNGEFLFFQP